MGSLYLFTRSSAIAELTAAVYVDYVSLVRILYNKYVGPPYCRTEKNAGRVTCCYLVSHGEYANGTDKQTDGRTPDRYITLSAKLVQRNNQPNSTRCNLLQGAAKLSVPSLPIRKSGSRFFGFTCRRSRRRWSAAEGHGRASSCS